MGQIYAWISADHASLTGFADREMGFGSFPSGEAMLVPEEDTADGTFVANSFGQVVYIDGSVRKLGLLVNL